jgi:hypothetical protein
VEEPQVLGRFGIPNNPVEFDVISYDKYKEN